MKNPKHIMRNLLLAVFLLVAFAFANPVSATHIIGGELSYKYLGNDSFLITLDLYRNCNDNVAALDPVSYISIFREDGLLHPFIDKQDMRLDLIGIDTIPNNIAGDPCLFVPGDVCVERSRWQRKFKITGPGGFYITFQRCCRNADILNIVDPLNSGATYWTYISPLAKTLGNSGPTFGFYPPVFVCVNKEIEHPHAGTDINGDSLVYKFYTPFLGGSYTFPQPVPGNQPPVTDSLIQPPPYDPVTWVAPMYGLNQLLGPSTSPLSINSQTGLITGLPQIQGRFVVGVLVEEYRNGQLLSVLRRDFQYEVGTCAELDVQIVAPDAQCDDLTVNFGNTTNVAQNFIWYFDWPNPTPTLTQKEPTFTFPDTGTYIVALVAEPVGACVDTGFHTIYLQYNSLTPDFSWQTYDCATQSVLVLQDLSVDPVSPVVEWSWTVTYAGTTLNSNLQNPVFQIPNPANGIITLTVRSQNGCEQTKSVAYETGGNYPPDLLPDVVNICLGEMGQLNPVGALPGFNYLWAPPVPTNQQAFANPSVSPTQNTTYTVTITGFGGLCQSTAQVPVVVFQPVQLAFTPDTDCDATIVHFVNQSQNAPSGFVWNFGDPTTSADVSNQANPTWDYPAFGSYTVTLMTPPNAVCKDTIQQSILLEEKILEADFSYGYTGCDEDVVSIRFFDQTNNSEANTTGWLWTFSGVYTGTSNQMSPVVMVTQAGVLNVMLQVTTDEDCTDVSASQSLTIDLTELPNLPDDDEVLGCLNGGVTLNPGGDTSYLYSWSPSAGLSCTNCPSPHANPSQTTVYTAVVQNPNGADTCTITRTVTVTVPTNVNLVGSNDVQTCDESTTIFTSVGLLPVTFAWFDDNGGQVAGNVPTLTVPVSGYAYYVVRATDPEGCHYYDTINVVGGPANIEAVGSQIKCSNEPLDIFATNLDQNDTLVWQWAPDPIFTGATNVPNPEVQILTGDRWLYVTATNQFGCAATDSVYVAVVDIDNELNFEYVVECNGSSVQFVNTSTDAFNFSWNFGDPTATDDTSHLDNPIYIYPGPGTYPVQLTMDFDLACVDTLNKNVVIQSTQFVPDFTFEYLACETDSVDVQFHDATMILQAGITIDSFFWETSNGDTSSLPDPVFTIYEGETFVVTMTIFTSNDCDGSVVKELKLEFIEVNLSDTLVLCQGDSTALNPTGDLTYEYNWTPNTTISDPTAANPTVWPSQTTVYSVEITSLSPDTCSITRTVTVFVPEKLEVAAPADTLTCGNPVTLCASANLQPVDYQWFALPGGFVGEGVCLTILPSVDSEYELLGTDQYGCVDTDTVFVADESVKVNWQTVGAECPDDEVQLTVTNLDSDHNLGYAWSVVGPGQILPPANGPTVTVLTPSAGDAANYTVVATNQHACTASLTQTIGSYDFVPTVVESVAVCPGVSAELNPGANPNLDYLWSPATGLSCITCPNPTVNITQSTTYTVTVSGVFGLEQCQETLQVAVFSAPVIEIMETVDTFTCGEAIVIAAQTSVPVVTYLWTNSAGTTVGNQPTLSVDPVGVDTFTILVTDSYGCTETDAVAVANHQLDLLLDGGGVIDTCPMQSYNICITNLDPEDLLTYEWTASNGGTIDSLGNTACPVVTSQQGVTSIFEVLVTNQWGCSSTEQFDITTYTFDPMVRATVDICPDVPTPLNPEAANSTLDYYWTPSTGLSCTNCPNPIATIDEDQFYQVNVLGYNGLDTCSFTQTVQVRVMPKHNLETTPGDTVICDSVDVLLSAFYTSTFVNSVAWSQSLNFANPFSTANSVTVTPNGTVQYFVQTTDTLGCHDTSLIIINAYPVDITVGDLFNFCEEIGTLTIPVVNHHPDQTLTFSWTPTENIETQNPDGSIVLMGLDMDEIYIVDATNQYGCHEQDTADVFYYDIEPSLDAITSTMDTVLFGSGEFSQLGINEWPGYTYEWSPEEGLDDPNIHNPVATPPETTTYTVLVTDEGGCQASRSVTIFVWNPDCDEPNLFLPNAFTPNADGENDELWLRSNIIDEMELAIYNRWGQRVFYTEDQGTKWDGKMNGEGEVLSPDVYGFYLRAKCFNGQEYFKKGNITLLR